MYSTMDFYINQFSNYLAEAIHIGESAKITKSNQPITNVLISGLGGSGIGGSIACSLLADKIKVPMYVNNDYFLPAYVDENTLLIISSYSGNTEETLEALEIGSQKNAKIVCITTENGKIAKLARKREYDLIVIPEGNPPRACLSYSFPQVFFILNQHGLIDETPIQTLKLATSFLEQETPQIKERAKSIAEQLFGKLPVIYSDVRIGSVAVRFRQQLNENSKVLAWHHVIPEMNHNELVGWTTENQNLAVLFLRNEDDFHRNQTRIEINKKIVGNYTDTIIEIWSKGDSLIHKSLYLILLTDWISFELAQLRGVDAVEVKVIDYLKGELAKVN